MSLDGLVTAEGHKLAQTMPLQQQLPKQNSFAPLAFEASQCQEKVAKTANDRMMCKIVFLCDIKVNNVCIAEVVGGNPVFCDGTGTITASIIGNPGGLFVYQWSPELGLSNPGQATTAVALVQDTMTYTVTAYPLGLPGCATTAEVTVMLDPIRQQ